MQTCFCNCVHYFSFFFNPNQTGAISPEPNLHWTSGQSVNSSLFVSVQQEKNRTLYLSRFNRGGLTKFENTFFQIAKLRFSTIFNDFLQNSEFSKDSQGMSLKSHIVDSSPLYTYLSPCKNKFCKIIKMDNIQGGPFRPPHA